MNIPVLILPGLSDSGPDHWQTLWEQSNPEFRRVSHYDWHAPELDRWLDSIEKAIRECSIPPIVAAHSLGCVALAHCIASRHTRLAGAMLVAPADAERSGTAYDISSFAPIPKIRFEFPSVLIASSNDPWCTLERAQEMAHTWGSRFVNAGALGHINVAAGFGRWPHGEKLFADLEQECALSLFGLRLDARA